MKLNVQHGTFNEFVRRLYYAYQFVFVNWHSKGVFFFIAIFIVQHTMHSWVELNCIDKPFQSNRLKFKYPYTLPYTDTRNSTHTHTCTYLCFNWYIHLYHSIETVFDGEFRCMGKVEKSQFAWNILLSISFNSEKPKSSRLKIRKLINLAAYIDNNCILTNLQKTMERCKKHLLRDTAQN